MALQVKIGILDLSRYYLFLSIIIARILLAHRVYSAEGSRGGRSAASSGPSHSPRCIGGCIGSRRCPSMAGLSDVTFNFFSPSKEKLKVRLNSSLDGVPFDPSLWTRIIIHGFSSNSNWWAVEMKNELLNKERMNVITVDWSENAWGSYERAYNATRNVAITVGILLDRLAMTKFGDRDLLDTTKVHIIGHSLGGHVAGFVGQYLKTKLGRITGLDPAEMFFANVLNDCRLSEDDAQFVDVIHTDCRPNSAIKVGICENIGHVDFHPNGGSDQPGCSDNSERRWGWWLTSTRKSTSCSHSSAHKYFIKSINDCQFWANPCSSYSLFDYGCCTKCSQDADSCIQMGFNARLPKHSHNVAAAALAPGSLPSAASLTDGGPIPAVRSTLSYYLYINRQTRCGEEYRKRPSLLRCPTSTLKNLVSSRQPPSTGSTDSSSSNDKSDNTQFNSTTDIDNKSRDPRDSVLQSLWLPIVIVVVIISIVGLLCLAYFCYLRRKPRSVRLVNVPTELSLDKMEEAVSANAGTAHNSRSPKRHSTPTSSSNGATVAAASLNATSSSIVRNSSQVPLLDAAA